MANNHAIFNSIHMACWNIDACNMAGVYATSDLDNGTLVTLTKINRDNTTGVVGGFEYEVTPATAGASDLWVVESPEVGMNIESQLFDDPRYFYNPAGKAFSIKYIVPKMDVLEYEKTSFASGTLPVAADLGKYVQAAANGKLGAPASNAPVSGSYFRIEGFHKFIIGDVEVPSVLLRAMVN